MTLLPRMSILWGIPLPYSNPTRKTEQDKLGLWREKGGLAVTRWAEGGGRAACSPPSSPNPPLMRPVFGVISRNHSAER